MPVTKQVEITPPNMRIAAFTIRGDAPYVQNKFSQKARQQIHETQEAGSTSKSKRGHKAKDFEAAYKGAMHISHEGWHGIPAPAFRKALVSACRTVGFTMTLAKLSVFVLPDGFDADDETPLVKITKGGPSYLELPVRISKGSTDLRARPMWQPGWEAVVHVRFDADQFTDADISSLLMRVGMQVGIGEGRPDSPNSTGMGWGTFEVLE